MAGSAGAKIHVGIGGWNFPPWRGTFYPPGLAQKRELEYASHRLSSIEVNGTFYGTQKRESFARWYAGTAEGFVFSLKGPRAATYRRALAESGPSIERFFASGVTELKEKLGPINWQFPSSRPYDSAQFEEFLKLLPARVAGRTIRHVVEVRHPSFSVPEFVRLVRSYRVGVVLADKQGSPQIDDATSPFVYVRLQRASADLTSGYPLEALDDWARRAQAWSRGEAPNGPGSGSPGVGPKPRDVFIYMINGFKPKAPAAALALIERLARLSE